MKKILFIMLVCCFPLISIAQTSLNGFYIGLEEMCSTDSAGLKECYTDPGHPERKWYHLTQMTIHGDSIFWDQSPISVYKKDTLHSASDGAFFYYKGAFNRNKDLLTINFTEISCDYCATEVITQSDGAEVEVKRTRQLVATVTNKGILINGYLFTKRKPKRFQ
ncbi:hypothetical protein GO495_02285 [Chitinophaga oryziterrae]|uniref:Uncharacterized protein n=1 Tax=Chitinophaga oryziterrae TaxID=1031224 RepID=A0A6N8J5F6_9BACT|nr:hypothetical protein [Chitinophaga oryziterrae]MVT39402.1 hypothetical protein [Chitinophaga oryziterrae]